MINYSTAKLVNNHEKLRWFSESAPSNEQKKRVSFLGTKNRVDQCYLISTVQVSNLISIGQVSYLIGTVQEYVKL